VHSEALIRGVREKAAIPITEKCKVEFESQSPLISRCRAWLRDGKCWLRRMLNPECFHPRRIRARSGVRYLDDTGGMAGLHSAIGIRRPTSTLSSHGWFWPNSQICPSRCGNIREVQGGRTSARRHRIFIKLLVWGRTISR